MTTESLTPTTDDFAAMLEASLAGRDIAEGQVVKGSVTAIENDFVVVDVGLKTEGRIPLREFTGPGSKAPSVGDDVEVYLERIENALGDAILSRDKARREESWDRLEKSFEKKEPVNGAIVGRVKGGFTVDLGGASAFLPGSQVDIRPVRDVGPLMNQEQPFAILKMDRPRGNIVVSRRAVLEESRAEQRAELVGQLAEGEAREGVVKNITDYGAFIDLGGIDGLLHVTDMSWGRAAHPSDLFKVNDEVDVVVLKFDRTTERVSLGYKQLHVDPWTAVDERYQSGERVNGKVVSLTDYGAFIELEPGVEGLIHVSEMSWSKRVKHPSKVLNVGDAVESMVLGVDPQARRISLGLKQVESNPWHQLIDKYPIGSTLTGKVSNLTEFGAFVEVEEGIDGLIHISDMSWSKRLNHPSEVLKKGDEVEAMVLNIDPDNQRLSLGLKQLATDIWDEFFENHKVGSVIEGKVVRITNFGAFVELVEGIEGLIHVSEFEDESSREKVELKVDEMTSMKIIKLSPSERKIGLSIRALKSDDYDTDWETIDAASGSPAVTLGDHFKKQTE